MAQRHFRFLIEDDPNRNDDEDDEEEEEEHDDDVIQVDDSPDEDDANIEDDNDDGASDAGTVNSVQDDANHGYNRNPVNPYPFAVEVFDEDAMTWESRSTISEGDLEPETDEWYPLNKRVTQLPNFALPTTTRMALCTLQQILADSANHEPFLEETTVMESTRAREHARLGISQNTDNTRVEPMNYVKYEIEKEEEFDADFMRPNPNRQEMCQIALDYFIHHGHAEVIETFCKETGLVKPEDEIKEMNIRNEIREIILQGNMELAIEKIEAISENLLKDEGVNFEVRKQHIIEMIRAKQEMEPVMYFREKLMIDGKRPIDERMEIIERIFCLLVYQEEDEHNEFKCYYDQAEREKTAYAVNKALLGAMGRPKSSRVEMLAKAMAYAKTEMENSGTLLPPADPKTTTKEWAAKFFGEPYGFQEMIDLAAKEPLDLTQDFC
ncbi:unnamed protein product [Caenorhabditis sp. 36 PRJEB53466]|nr:unnamed protein product [Caenorhabditis sp. 36 PRJEB53466]